MIIDLKKSRSTQFGLDPDYYNSGWARCKACFFLFWETLILLVYYSDRVLWRSVWFCHKDFEPFFCFNFESRLLWKKGPQFILDLGQKKVSFCFFFPRNYFDWKKKFLQQTCQSTGKKWPHIFVASSSASLHFPSRKNVASRDREKE